VTGIVDGDFELIYGKVRTRIANYTGLASLGDDRRGLRHVHGFGRRHDCNCVQEQENFVETVTQRNKGHSSKYIQLDTRASPPEPSDPAQPAFDHDTVGTAYAPLSAMARCWPRTFPSL